MGRPNQQAELQKIQILGPQILQMLQAMGKSPEPLLRLVLKTYDANIDLDRLLADAQVLPPPPSPGPEPQKPPSLAMSLNVKDLPPEEQEQAVQQFGLKPAPAASRLINQIGHDKAVQAAHENAKGAGGGLPHHQGGGPMPVSPAISSNLSRL